MYYFKAKEKKMICANYKDLTIPENLKSPNWEKALAWLKADSWKDIPEGKTEIDGANVYVLRSTRMGKKPSESQYECHRIYADIQMSIKGAELQLVCPRDGLKTAVPYSEEKDIEFLEGAPEKVHSVILNFPLAVVYFPWDMHMPNLSASDKPGEVDKIVLKVAL